jgi:ankyrin repeat protein
VPYYIYTAVTKIIENKHFEILELLIKSELHRHFLNNKRKEGRTHIIQGIIDNEEVLVKLLVEGRADLTITDDILGCTPLMWAVTANNINMAKLLIDGKANVNTARESDGMTALMFSRSADMTKLLMESGADIHAKNYLGMTALMYAQESKDMEIAKLLIEEIK